MVSSFCLQMVGTSETTFIMIPFTSLPFPPKNTTSPQHYISIAQGLLLSAREARFNDGFCDPAGRFVSGTMSSGGHGCRDGILYSIGTPENAHTSPLERTYVPQQILDGITVTNGTGWTVKGDKMLFSDSWTRTIFGFDYDLVRVNPNYPWWELGVTDPTFCRRLARCQIGRCSIKQTTMLLENQMDCVWMTKVGFMIT